MIINILIIYLTIMCWYSYSWFRYNTSMVIINNKSLIKHILVVFSFIAFFFVFVRVMNLFRDSKIFDLKLISLDWYFVFGFLFIYSIRRLVFYIVKIHWYRLHCFLLSPENLPSYKLYCNLYLRIFYRIAIYSLNYLSYINFLLFVGLFIVLGFDLVFNDLVLKYFFSYLVYYSLFKIIYILISFVATKQDLKLDYYNYNCYYPGNLDTKEFWQTYDSKILDNARIYKDTIILELDYFDSRFIHLKGTQRYEDLKKGYNTLTTKEFEQLLKFNQKEREAIIKINKNKTLNQYQLPLPG